MSFSEMIGKTDFPYSFVGGEHRWYPSWKSPRGGKIVVGSGGIFYELPVNTAIPQPSLKRFSPKKEKGEFPYLMGKGILAHPHDISELGKMLNMKEIALADENSLLARFVFHWAQRIFGEYAEALEDQDYKALKELMQGYTDRLPKLTKEDLLDAAGTFTLSSDEAYAFRKMLGETRAELASFLGITEGQLKKRETEDGAMGQVESLCYLFGAINVLNIETEAHLHNRYPFFMDDGFFGLSLEADDFKELRAKIPMSSDELSTLLSIHPSSLAHFSADNERKATDSIALVVQYLAFLELS